MSQNEMQTVTFDEPITYGKDKLDKIQLRRPKAGDLRGVKLSEVGDLSTDEILKITPRIAIPAVTAGQLNELDSADLLKLGAAIAGFFNPKDKTDSATSKE